MAEAKKYTLVRKKSIHGPVDNPYTFTRGQVIGEAEFKKLTKRHKDLFDEGAKDLPGSPNTVDTEQDKDIADLELRVKDLEAAVTSNNEEIADLKKAISNILPEAGTQKPAAKESTKKG